MDGALAGAVEAAFGAQVVASGRVHGGDVAIAYQVDLADGERVFVKSHRDPPPGFFTTEAAGLSWLAQAAAVSVPTVLAVADSPVPFLALSWIDTGLPRPGTDAAFGTDLAALHRAGAPCFGREDRRTTGSRRLPNEPSESWVEFYAGARLRPLARLARDAGALPPAVIDGLERVADGLDRWAGPGEPPARLHGDLWAGNRLVGIDGRSWLIDPACFGGHREFDLAMMRLFGGFGPDCFTAYDEAFPLAPGWEQRIALHQIAPLVVHAIKFGGGYVRAATHAIRQYTG